MSNVKTDNNPTKVLIGPVRFSYAHVWEPTRIDENSKPKYSVALIIPKSNKALVKAIQAGINAAEEIGKVKVWEGKVPKNLKRPLRDGDEERGGDENYEDCYWINASCVVPPGITEMQNGKAVKIIDQDEFYSGCYGYASVNFYPFPKDSPSKGIACGLNNLLKTKEGERLDGRSTAESDFNDLEVDDDGIM